MNLERFRTLIDSQALLTRKRLAVEDAAHTEQDQRILEEIVGGVLSDADFEARAKGIAKRFAPDDAEISFGAGKGTAKTPYVLAPAASPSKQQIRIKFGKPYSIDHNLQHVKFLNARGEAGWSATVMYSPVSLWLGMINGPSGDFMSLLEHDSPENPLRLLSLYEFMAQYATKQNHRENPMYVARGLELIRCRMLGEIGSSSKLTSEQKDEFAGLEIEAIDYLLKVRGDAQATWCLADAHPANFTDLINGKPVTIIDGDKERVLHSFPVVFDQGHGAPLLTDWTARNPGATADDAFLGRIEYDLGWQSAAIQTAPRIDSKIMKLHAELLEELVTTGRFRVPWPDVPKFEANQRSYSLPSPHVKDLSKGLISLGMANYLINRLSYEGLQPDIASVAKTCLLALRQGNMNFQIYKDLQHLGV
ncbi:MAG: hypothetical protein AABX75_03205 [Nanoarchaeota archaeon]